jgi:hypothetical protein
VRGEARARAELAAGGEKPSPARAGWHLSELVAKLAPHSRR